MRAIFLFARRLKQSGIGMNTTAYSAHGHERSFWKIHACFARMLSRVSTSRERLSVSCKLLNAKKPLNRDSICFCQSKNLLATRHITSSFPSGESCPRNACQFGCFLLSQLGFFSEIVQPCSVRIAPCFWFSTHARARIICKIWSRSLLSKSRQRRNLLLTEGGRSAKTVITLTSSIHGRMLIVHPAGVQKAPKSSVYGYFIRRPLNRNGKGT